MPEKKRAVLTPSRILIHGILVKNPVLVQVIGLCPAVAAAADIYASTVLSLLVTGLMIICECFASLFLKKVPRRVRVAMYFIIGLVVCAYTSAFLERGAPELLNRVGVYLPLMAASSAVALRCENFAVNKSLRLSFLDALANGLGTSLVLMTSGLVRGLLGSGTIGDWKVFSVPPLRGLAMPFGGFIVLGFSAAFLKWFISVFLSQYDSEMAFGIKKNRKPKQTATVVQTVPAKSVAEPETQKGAEATAASQDAQSAPKTAPPAAPAPAQTQPRRKSVADEESTAADFYERASSEETEDAMPLFDVGAFNLQDELDAILADIEGLEDAAFGRKEEDDA